MKKHFVKFISPGTFFPEINEQPVASWDIQKASDMARSVKERYDAKPYAFTFVTRSRGLFDLDSKITAQSPFYFLGGTVRTQAEVLAGTDPAEEILRDNVRCNDIKRVITNINSFKAVLPLNDDDVVLEWTP